jgi:hypothetical protein
MLEAAENQEVKGRCDPGSSENRAVLESRISCKFPFYNLLVRVRIHDFHRFGILPPDPGARQVMVGGPLKLTANMGSATISVGAQGIQETTTGKSHVEQQRPLINQDGAFFDEQSSEFVDLDKVLEAFLGEAPKIIAEFENDLRL